MCSTCLFFSINTKFIRRRCGLDQYAARRVYASIHYLHKGLIAAAVRGRVFNGRCWFGARFFWLSSENLWVFSVGDVLSWRVADQHRLKVKSPYLKGL